MSKNLEAFARCTCGCTVIVLERLADDDQVYLEVYDSRFYASGKSKLADYFVRLWSAIRGQDYLLFDIVLSHREAKDLLRSFTTVMEEK